MVKIIKASELRKLNNSLEEQLKRIERALINAQEKQCCNSLTVKVNSNFCKSIVDILEDNGYICVPSLSNEYIKIIW